MIVLYRKQLKHTLITIGTDRCVGFMPIAPGGVLRKVWMNVHLVADVAMDVGLAQIIPMRGYCFDILEIDDLTGTEDQLWDQNVPKDDDIGTSAGNLELDVTRDSTETAVFEEPGEPDANKLFGLDDPYTKIFDQQPLVSFGSSPTGFESGTPDTYYPTVTVRDRWQGRRSFPTGGAVMYGIAVPAMDDVTTTPAPGITSQADYVSYSHLQMVLDLAKPWLLGLSEAGAETPGVDFAQLLEELTEPTVYEETASAWATGAMNVWSRFTFEVSVPDEAGRNVIAS